MTNLEMVVFVKMSFLVKFTKLLMIRSISVIDEVFRVITILIVVGI